MPRDSKQRICTDAFISIMIAVQGEAMQLSQQSRGVHPEVQS